MACETHAGILMDFLYGELSPSEAERFLEHTHACASCREELEGLTALRSTLALAPPLPEPPSAITERILDAARNPERLQTGKGSEDRTPGWLSWLTRPWTLGLAAAAAGATAVLLVGTQALNSMKQEAPAAQTPMAVPPASPAQPLADQEAQAPIVATRGTGPERADKAPADDLAGKLAAPRKPEPARKDRAAGRPKPSTGEEARQAAAGYAGPADHTREVSGERDTRQRGEAAKAEVAVERKAMKLPEEGTAARPTETAAEAEEPARSQPRMAVANLHPQEAAEDIAAAAPAATAAPSGVAQDKGRAGRVARREVLSLPPPPAEDVAVGKKALPANSAPAPSPPAPTAQPAQAPAPPADGRTVQRKDKTIIPPGFRQDEDKPTRVALMQFKKAESKLQAQSEMTVGADMLAAKRWDDALVAFQNAERFDASRELAPQPQAGQVKALAASNRCGEALGIARRIGQTHASFAGQPDLLLRVATCLERQGKAAEAKALQTEAERLAQKLSGKPAR